VVTVMVAAVVPVVAAAVVAVMPVMPPPVPPLVVLAEAGPARALRHRPGPMPVVAVGADLLLGRRSSGGSRCARQGRRDRHYGEHGHGRNDANGASSSLHVSSPRSLRTL
jgi:hypothetical protein